jgi:hypothetical protein
MKPRKPNKTESTFSNNQPIRRETEVRRDTDKQKNISVSLYDIDYNVKWHIENVIVPQLVDNGQVIKVPVIFSSPEKWASIREQGYLRDNGQKMIAPLLVIKRNSVTPREDINTSAVFRDSVNKDSNNAILFEKKYTKENRYDQFSLLNGRPPLREFYSIEIPTYVEVQYDIMIWTDTIVQLNEVVEQVLFYDGKAFGDTYKFLTYIDTPTFEHVNTTGDDRIVRCNISFRTKGYLIQENLDKRNNMRKFFNMNKLRFGIEVTGTGETIELNPNATKLQSVTTTRSAPIVELVMTDILKYLDTNITVNADDVTSGYADFNGVQILNPPDARLPNTDKYSFTYFINGQYATPAAIISIVNITPTAVRVTFDTSILEFTLSNTDVITVSGKFTGVNDSTI